MQIQSTMGGLGDLGGFDWQGTAKAVNAQLAQMNPPLSLADFDPVKYNAMYPDVAARYPDTTTAWDKQSPKNIGSYKKPIDHYLQYGMNEGKTFATKDTTLARQLQEQFALADYVAANAMRQAGVTGGDFDPEKFTAAHRGDPAWYPSWSPWQFYVYFGLANGYPFTLKDGTSGVVPTSTTTPALPAPTSVPTIVTPAIAPVTGDTPATQSYPGYSPFQTNYVVPPGIPDTGIPNIPGTGTGAPSAPLTYDQVTKSVDAASSSSASKSTQLLLLAAAAAGGYYLYTKNKKGKRAPHHASAI